MRSVFSFASSFLVLMALVLLLPAAPASAQPEDNSGLYAVGDVVADITADSAAHARDQALVAAQRSALEQVLERLGADPSLADKADDDTVASLVQNLEVDSERSSTVRYIGVYTVQFRPSAVRAWLTQKNVAFKEDIAAPVVILPVYGGGDHPILWEQPTSWWNAWENAHGGGRVPIIMPAGGLGDIALIGTADVLGGNATALKALIGKYNAGGAAVAKLTSNPAPPDATLKINIMLYDANGMPVGKPISLGLPGASDSDTIDAALANAVRAVHESIESVPQSGAVADQDTGQADRETADQSANPPAPAPAAETAANTQTAGAQTAGATTSTASAPGNATTADAAPTHLEVTVPTATPADWEAVKRKLDQVSAIEQANVIMMSRGATSVDLAFRGPVAQLQTALAGQQLDLAQDAASGAWTLRPAGSLL